MNVKGEKSSYNFLTKASEEMGPKHFLRHNFSLFLVKFKKLGFKCPFNTVSLFILETLYY